MRARTRKPYWNPYFGGAALGVLLYSVIARLRLPGNIPGAFAAVLVGVVLYYSLGPAGLLAEFEAFLAFSPHQAETGLFIVANGLDDFEEFLDLLDLADAALDQAGLRGVLQLASFHPHYVFAGASAGDPANYTNRSPYPMLHLIREAGLDAALETYPDPEGIPERNIRTLRNLGLAEVRKRLAECRDSD